jgi:succinate dehydrogenase / fumarate reductase cytochrome b subunit
MSSPPLDSHFVIRKVHSLVGIVPIGAFLCFHLFENSLSVHGGAHFYEHVIRKIGEMPYVELMEVFAIAAPILFHGIYGIVIWLGGTTNVSHYGYFRNWMYLVQRVTGAITIAFVLSHVATTRLQVLLGNVDKADLFAHLHTSLENPLMLAWYVVGTVSAIIHLVNGVWLALITWGITIGPRSQKISTVICGLVGVALLVLAIQALRGFTAPLTT